jgi:hypothetical protein
VINSGAIAIDTGGMKHLGIQMPQITSHAVSAEGRRIAITGASNRNEIRVLRNILAPEAAR